MGLTARRAPGVSWGARPSPPDLSGGLDRGSAGTHVLPRENPPSSPPAKGGKRAVSRYPKTADGHRLPTELIQTPRDETSTLHLLIDNTLSVYMRPIMSAEGNLFLKSIRLNLTLGSIIGRRPEKSVVLWRAA